MVTSPQLSVARGSSNPNKSSHSTVKFSGASMTGAVVSSTVMVWVPVEELPASSVAVKVLIME